MNPILKFAVVLKSPPPRRKLARVPRRSRIGLPPPSTIPTRRRRSAWRKAEPDKPERLVAAANYWWRLAAPVRIDASKKRRSIARRERQARREHRTWVRSRLRPLKAVAALREAGRLSDQLDIWCGLPPAPGIAPKNPKDQLDVLKAMVAHAKQAKPGSLRWMDGPLDAEPGEFVADKVHAYGAHYYRMENEFGDQAFGAIVGLLNKEFPEFAVGWNDQALYQHFIKRDTKAAIAALEKAHALSPDDYLIVFNIAKFAALSGDKPKAVAWFTKVIEKSGDEDLSANAKEEIAALEKGES
ncbi:MAG: hypothetical protein R3F11_05335 [Verrucomicrobiales bacterium]